MSLFYLIISEATLVYISQMVTNPNEIRFDFEIVLEFIFE